jgi:hypothetical protein
MEETRRAPSPRTCSLAGEETRAPKIGEFLHLLSSKIETKMILFYSFIYITYNLSLSQTNQYQSTRGDHLRFCSSPISSLADSDNRNRRISPILEA